MYKIMRTALLLLLIGTTLTGCVSDKNIIYLQGANEVYAVPKAIEQAIELRIQPDDQLAIAVTSKDRELIELFNNNTLIGGGAIVNTNNVNIQSGVSYFRVDKNGNIAFPIFGTIYVRGLTTLEVSKIIEQKLKTGGYINDAVVNTKIMSFKVTVLGDVKNPGRQEFTGERLTLLEAIGRAGDLNNTAHRDHVLVVREENGQRVTYDVDLRDEASVFASPAYYLQQNDVIYVKPNKAVRIKGSTSYTWLSVSSTLIGMVVSVVSLIIAITK